MTTTWTDHITPKMNADARRQTARLVANGATTEAAAAESAAWVAMKAKRAAMIQNLRNAS